MIHNSYSVDFAKEDDLISLPAIEQTAAELFSADDVPLKLRSNVTLLSEFQAAQHEERLWVARSSDGKPVGFAIVKLLDGTAYLEEMDVLPAHTRRGIGRLLLEAVCRWARERSIPAVTLTTFRHIPWNAPFYSRYGFIELGAGELTPGLSDALSSQASRGLNIENRVAMRLDLKT